MRSAPLLESFSDPRRRNGQIAIEVSAGQWPLHFDTLQHFSAPDYNAVSAPSNATRAAQPRILSSAFGVLILPAIVQGLTFKPALRILVVADLLQSDETKSP